MQVSSVHNLERTFNLSTLCDRCSRATILEHYSDLLTFMFHIRHFNIRICWFKIFLKNVPGSLLFTLPDK